MREQRKPLGVLAAAALVAVTAGGPAHAVELLWSGPSSSYGEHVRSVVYPAPGVDEEAADDFDIQGTVERLIVYGSNDCTFGCYAPPQPTGVWVRFYESTPGGPGSLQYEEFLAAGDTNFVYDGVDGVRSVDVTLHQPFAATGRHFLSVQLEFDETFNWKRAPSRDNDPLAAAAVWRDNLTGGAWEPPRDYWGATVNQDLSVDIYGCPTGGCQPPPLVAGCGEWVEVQSPSPSGDARLLDVEALAPWDVWAVGSHNGPVPGYWEDRQQSLTMHWNGNEWSIVPSPSPAPSPSATQVELVAVSGAATDDVWAVGSKRDQDTAGYTGSRVLAMRWNGFEWRDMDAPWPTDGDGTPYTGASGEQLYDVAAVASDEVWMVGRYWVEAPSGAITWPGAAMRWNGAGFEVFLLPMVSPQGSQWANAVAAVSGNDVWAVGDGAGTNEPAYIWHWNGAAWSPVPAPTPGEDRSLRAVVSLAADDVWAGGSYRDASYVHHPLLLHWDGTSWTQVQAPAGGDAFVAWATDDILTRGTGGWAHWDGTAWSADEGPLLIPSGVVSGLDAIGPCELWAVGWRYDVRREMVLTEKLRSANNPPGDADGDGVPDAADNCPTDYNPDQADCDADGAGDTCELNQGTAADCNGNGTPDNCETFADCNANGVPDECEADCNANGLPDECDIGVGASRDCEPDGVPDECQTFDDCNGNGVNDACDIRSAASADANANGYPDECEAIGPDIATVTTCADVVDFGGAQGIADLPGPDGLVSFREALTAVNNEPGPQTVAFNIPKVRWESLYDDRAILRLDQGLFRVEDDGTTIDFTTQTRFTGDTNPGGNEVGIYGFEPNAWGVQAIHVFADDCVIKGLDRVMQRGYGVKITGNRNRVIGSSVSGPFYAGVYIQGGQGSVPTGNVIGGTGPGEGNSLGSGNDGVRIDGPAEQNVVIGNRLTGVYHGVHLRAGATNNRIGGPTAPERNVIAGAGTFGEEGCPDGSQVAIEDSNDNVVEGNYIGTTADGLAGAGQDGTAGVLVRNSARTAIRDNLVADILVVGTNHCSGIRYGDAIAVQGGSPLTTILGNRLGTDATGATALVNRAGIVLGAWPGTGSPQSISIGGLGGGEGNLVTNSELDGVRVGPGVAGATISANSIFDNGGLGINLSGTGNGGQQAPEITSAVTDDLSIAIEGVLSSAASRRYRIEFFASATCDPSGFGEGERFLGWTEVVTDPSGVAGFDVTLPEVVAAGEVVTTTATSTVSGNTSEFSACAAVQQGACGGPPGLVQRLMVGELAADRVSWEGFGPSVRYDVSRGYTHELGSTDAACVASGLSDAWYDDPSAPPAGLSFYYLVRASNGCGAGPWSEGAARGACP